MGGGQPVTPEDRGAPRAEPFEISQEAGDRQGEEEQQPQEATDEELEQARLQADQTAIEGIRRAEVCCFLFPEINCHGNVLFFSCLCSCVCQYFVCTERFLDRRLGGQ